MRHGLVRIYLVIKFDQFMVYSLVHSSRYNRGEDPGIQFPPINITTQQKVQNEKQDKT